MSEPQKPESKISESKTEEAPKLQSVPDLSDAEAPQPEQPPAEQPEGAPTGDGLIEAKPELKEDFDRLHAIMRGNERLERRLNTILDRQTGQPKMLNPMAVVMMRQDILIDLLLGHPAHSRNRLDYELQFAERLRTALNTALLQP